MDEHLHFLNIIIFSIPTICSTEIYRSIYKLLFVDAAL